MGINTINLFRAYSSATAEAVDSFRVVPRIILFLYGWYVYKVGNWFMNLESPDTQQAAFVSTVVGAAALIIGFYQKSGKEWGLEGFKVWPFKEISTPQKIEVNKLEK